MNTHATASLLTQLAPQQAPQADAVAMLGFLAAFFTIVFALYQRESRAFVLMMAIGLAVLSVYGFLEGVWPLGFVNVFASAAAFRKWRRRGTYFVPTPHVQPMQRWVSESRMSRMFGSN